MSKRWSEYVAHSIEWVVAASLAVGLAAGINQYQRSRQELDFPQAVTESIKLLNQANILRVPLTVHDHRWQVLPDSISSKGMIDYGTNTISLQEPANVQLREAGEFLQKYALPILHEHSHWWFYAHLTRGSQKEFARIVRARLDEFENTKSSRSTQDMNLRKYAYLHSTIPSYQELYGEQFDHEFYGAEAFATFAGSLAGELWRGRQVDAIPEELTPFFDEYLHKRHIELAHRE